jgi:SAM-dependent methyltransferase
VRRSRAGRWLKHFVLGPQTPVESPSQIAEPAEAQPVTPPDQRVITTLEELDDVMRELESAALVSDDALRRGFATFRMAPSDEPADDPDSESYRARQFGIYERLHGKPYDVTSEASVFDPLQMADRPFPFLTRSASTVGDQMIAIGFLIRHMNLPPESTVLEFGPGWGNTTLALARMGHTVTAIDIEPNFIRLIEERSRRKGLTIETIQGDFSRIADLDRKFHTVLFFESFHHCANHQVLVAQLARVVAPGGQLVFAGEPIDPAFPLPWGVRLDGESLWAIRRYGWLELGFREDYFRALLARHGWTVRKEVCSVLDGPHTGWGTVFIAQRTD